MASPVESGDKPKLRLVLSELITTEPIIDKKASSRSQLAGNDEERDRMDPAANGDVVVYRLYRRRWLGLGEHTS